MCQNVFKGKAFWYCIILVGILSCQVRGKNVFGTGIIVCFISCKSHTVELLNNNTVPNIIPFDGKNTVKRYNFFHVG